MKKKVKPAKKKKNASGSNDKLLREHLVYLLKGGGAHVHFMDAVEGFPEAKRGAFVAGLPHTGWQLLEHSRIARSTSRPDFPKATGRRRPCLRMGPRGTNP